MELFFKQRNVTLLIFFHIKEENKLCLQVHQPPSHAKKNVECENIGYRNSERKYDE